MRLRTFGTVRIEGAAHALGGAAAQRRPLALLLVVAAAGDRGVSRDKVMGLLWPESDVEHARNALRQTLHSLRRDLGSPELFSGVTDIRVNAAVLPSDVAEFDVAVGHGDRERTVALYEARLADGFFLAKAPEFERWLEDERRLRAQQFGDAIEALAGAATKRGHPEEAVALWRKLAVDDRLSARVATQLMCALAAAGDRAAAIQHARVYEALVRAELDTAADPAVTALAAKLRLESRGSPVAAMREPGPSSPASGVVATDGWVARAPLVTSYEPPEAVASGSALAGATQTALPEIDPRVRTTNRSEPAPVPRLPADLSQSPALSTRMLVALVLGGAVAVVAAVIARPGPDPALDSELHAVMPFAQTTGDSASGLLGDECQILLENAMAHWRGIGIVDQMRVRSAYHQYVAGRADPTRILRAARSLGAGIAVWGTVNTVADSIYVRAALYDVAAGGKTIRSHQVSVGRYFQQAELSRKFRELADALLLDEAPAPMVADAVGTTSVPAWRAYSAGHRALGQWDLGAARHELQHAIQLDPQFAQAHLWLAQIAAYDGARDSTSWRVASTRAAALRSRLSPIDGEIALALRDLAHARFPEACQRFAAIRARDSLESRAWYGLGECQAMDPLVVSDSRSPTGWRFRSSQRAAIAAYVRALELAPASHRAFSGQSFQRLRELLYVDLFMMRLGYRIGEGSDTIRYGAFASVERDTLGFVPYTLTEIRTKLETQPRTHAAAVGRTRDLLRQLTELWFHAFPRSPDAAEGHARALEATGEIAAASPPRSSALRMARTARSLSDDPVQRLRLSIAEVRLLLKTDDYAGAADLADSLLATLRHPRNADEAGRGAALAALLGKVNLAALLAADSRPSYRVGLPDGAQVIVPVTALRPALSLNVYAAFGGPKDSIRILWRRVSSEIQAREPPERQAAASVALLRRPALFAFAVTGPTPLHQGPRFADPWYFDLQTAVLAGDTAMPRARIDTALALRRSNPMNPWSTAFVLPAAQLMLAIGDTARGVALLDSFVDQLPRARQDILDDAADVAARVRSMALRAELAATAGDTSTARRWAGAVAALWQGADPALAPFVSRIRALTAQRRR